MYDRTASAAVLVISGSLCFAQAATPPDTPATSVQQPPATGVSETAAQFAKSPDVVVAEVNGTPITSGMVADRLCEFPDKFGVLPTQVIYKSALGRPHSATR
jgi:hypothetical protein